MTASERLLQVLKIFAKVSKENNFPIDFEARCKDCLDEARDVFRNNLLFRCKWEKYTIEQAQELFKCMTAGSTDKVDLRKSLIEKSKFDDENTMQKLCSGFDVRRGSRYLSALKHLRNIGVFHKSDIRDWQLLRYCCNYNTYCIKTRMNSRANKCIFNYLAEWDPTALMNLEYFDEERCNKYYYQDESSSSDEKSHNVRTLLQEVMCSTKYPIETIKLVLKAGLKYLPHELGLLLLRTDEYSSPLAYAFQRDRRYGSNAWAIIEECLDEVVGPNLKLQEPNPFTNLCPFLTAAVDQSSDNLDLVYYFLRKDPSVLSHFYSSGETKGRLRRKRKRIEKYVSYYG